MAVVRMPVSKIFDDQAGSINQFFKWMSAYPNTMERPAPIAVIIRRIFLFVFDSIFDKKRAKNFAFRLQCASDFTEINMNVSQLHVREDGKESDQVKMVGRDRERKIGRRIYAAGIVSLI